MADLSKKGVITAETETEIVDGAGVTLTAKGFFGVVHLVDCNKIKITLKIGSTFLMESTFQDGDIIPRVYDVQGSAADDITLQCVMQNGDSAIRSFVVEWDCQYESA